MFRYKADILPVTLFFLYFLLDVYVYFTVSALAFLLPYVAVSIVIKWFICAWNHHHQHVPTFSFPLINRLLEIIYGFQTGIVGYAWVLHHNLGHHVNYRDQVLDESAWKSPKGEVYTALSYTTIVTMTAYYRAWKVGAKYPKIRSYFVSMCMIQLILLIAILVYSPLSGFLIFALPMITGLIMTVYTTYAHHTGLESESHYESSYNILSPLYNIITGNLGYHTAHHMKWALHWSQLPEFHREISEHIAPRFYQKYTIL